MLKWVMLALLVGGVFWWAQLIKGIVRWGRTIAPVPQKRAVDVEEF